MNKNLIDRRDRLIAFINASECIVKVLEDDYSVLVNKTVTIRPPYLAEDCMSSNWETLSIIMNLLKRFDYHNAAETGRSEAVSTTDLASFKIDANASSSTEEATSQKKSGLKENRSSKTNKNVMSAAAIFPGTQISIKSYAILPTIIEETPSQENPTFSNTENLIAAVHNFPEKDSSLEDANVKSRIRNVLFDNSYSIQTTSFRGANFNPPYEVESCLSDNEIGLQSIHNLADHFKGMEVKKRKAEPIRDAELPSSKKSVFNKMPVIEIRPALLIDDNVTVNLPYEVESCLSDSEIGLQSIHNLADHIKRMEFKKRKAEPMKDDELPSSKKSFQ